MDQKNEPPWRGHELFKIKLKDDKNYSHIFS